MVFFELLASASIFSIILFIAGVGLIIAEMFEPGFGFFGAFGVISLIICIFVTANTVAEGLMLTAFFFVIVLILLAVFLVLVSKGKLPKRLILHEAETVEQGFTGTEDMKHLMGKTGIVTTICRPVGNVDFDGVKLEVISQSEFIDKGIMVEVIGIEGNRVVVKPLPETDN